MKYTHQTLTTDIKMIKNHFPETEIVSIGKSVWGSDIYCIKLGSGPKKIMYNGAHHGMEWITSALLMRFVWSFLKANSEGSAFGGFNTEALLKRCTLFVVPMVNPDGVRLSAMGMPRALDFYRKKQLLGWNMSANFTQWQANARGVDLNHNYDALWEKGKSMESGYNVHGPGPTRFSGAAPESEPESRAMAELTRKERFDMTMSFHSQGKVIYHGFMGKYPQNSFNIARALERISTYTIDYTEGIASFGGYKDWFVKEFNRVGFTVEVGMGQNPLPFSDLPQIYSETLPILLGGMTCV